MVEGTVTRLQNTPQIRRKLPVVEENLAVLAPNPGDLDHEVLKKDYSDRQRLKYASLRSHMEIAATVIAAGGSYAIAAEKAGVNPRQVRKYMTDSEFRDRVRELRELLMGQVRGRIIEEFGRRTEPEKIQRLEIMDLARIFDRTSGDSVSPESIETRKYDTIIQQVFIANAAPESSDFPEYEYEDVSVPDESTPERKQVSSG